MILFPGETLLQQKLQESNTRLYHDVGEMVRQLYSSASKEVCSYFLLHTELYVIFVGLIAENNTWVIKMTFKICMLCIFCAFLQCFNCSELTFEQQAFI